MRRVAITGLGVISAIGLSVSEFWQNLASGSCGIRPLTGVDASKLRFSKGAQVQAYDPTQHFDPNQLSYLDRFAQFAVVAAREAIADAGLVIAPELAPRTAVVFGSAIGGQSSQDAGFQDLYLNARNRVHPLTITRAMLNAGTSQICMELGITGPAFSIGTACSSANHAIGQAFWMVRSGVVDVAIAGGSEAPFSFGLLKAWEAMRVVSPDTCRPFSKDRSGLILGEGGAALVLEPMEAAMARGARIHGELVGFGMSSDAHHVTNPAVSGAANAMRAALADAAIDPARVGYINAHGTGTLANDVTETGAIRQVFSSHADGILVSSTKSMHGHALGAAGAIEAVATVRALENSVIPPTVNFTERDPQCALNLVLNSSRTANVEWAISNSFAFGGLNAVLAFRRAEKA